MRISDWSSDVCSSDLIHVFGAMIARSASEVRFRIRQRFGPLLEDQAIVRLGFDWSEPLACAMVSQAMAHLLMLAAEDPTRSEERRAGKACVSTCRSRRSPLH